MRAMRLQELTELSHDTLPLEPEDIPVPSPGEEDVLLEVLTCGVCHTELDEIEGRTPPAYLPMTPGHQVIGRVVETGSSCSRNLKGKRVGVAWIHHACGNCAWCRRGLENLCPEFTACGRDADGGYAEFMTVHEDFAHVVPDSIDDAQAAPLLCAGAVGLRALRLCQLDNGQPLGLTGFGASAHLVLQMARHLYPESPISVFARNPDEQDFARELGAEWAGDTDDTPPQPLTAMIDTTPAWRPVLAALERLAPGGRLVINAIRKEAGDQDVLLDLDYDRHLWREKQVSTVANVTRRDVRRCLELAAEMELTPTVTTYALEEANQALRDLKAGGGRGARVLRISTL